MAKVSEIFGPLVLIEGVKDVAYDEIVLIELNNKEERLGKVLEVKKLSFCSKFIPINF